MRLHNRYKLLRDAQNLPVWLHCSATWPASQWHLNLQILLNTTPSSTTVKTQWILPNTLDSSWTQPASQPAPPSVQQNRQPPVTFQGSPMQHRGVGLLAIEHSQTCWPTSTVHALGDFWSLAPRPLALFIHIYDPPSNTLLICLCGCVRDDRVPFKKLSHTHNPHLECSGMWTLCIAEESCAHNTLLQRSGVGPQCLDSLTITNVTGFYWRQLYEIGLRLPACWVWLIVFTFVKPVNSVNFFEKVGYSSFPASFCLDRKLKMITAGRSATTFCAKYLREWECDSTVSVVTSQPCWNFWNTFVYSAGGLRQSGLPHLCPFVQQPLCLHCARMGSRFTAELCDQRRAVLRWCLLRLQQQRNSSVTVKNLPLHPCPRKLHPAPGSECRGIK